MTDKESARSAWHGTLAENNGVPQWGKAAEKLRELKAYRAAAAVFATPGQSLHQARINCLVDGKNLVMPGPSIREGFFLLPAHSIPFKDLSAAVTYKALKKNGQQLKTKDIPKLSLGLLLTDSVAVDHAGGRLGDGNGFFDLCCALLQELGGLQHDITLLTFVMERQISQDLLPQDAWDVKMTGAITPSRIIQFGPSGPKPKIFWDAIDRQRIKRIDPLWKLFKDQGVKGSRIQGIERRTRTADREINRTE